MILIAAMSKDRVIGAGAGMPWSVPEEYAHFVSAVRGRAVLMGRRSFEIFGPDLVDSHLFVLSRSADARPGARIVASIDEAVRASHAVSDELFVAGGASVYRQSLPHADAMYLSIIGGDFEGDAYFPEFDASDWTIVRREERPGYLFLDYRRARRGSPGDGCTPDAAS